MRLTTLLIASLAATLTPFALAHGKVAAVVGDAGGNGTALGITGGDVPGTGPNRITETDTTVFKKTNIATDRLGKTTGAGKNTADGLAATMRQSGSTLPQVSVDNGSISGVFHIVTTASDSQDGAGPVSAVIDPTASGTFSQSIQANVVTDVPGNKGNIKASGRVPRALQALGLMKRAANVNKDFPINIQVPAGTTCTGSVAGQQNVCFMKIANANKAGPFGGVIAFQMVSASGSNITTSPRATPAGNTITAATGLTVAKRFWS